MSQPLCIGILTDGIEEGEVNGAVHVRNGGVGVYIYNLVKHLRAVDGTTEYVLIRYGQGRLDIYREGRSRSVMLNGTPLTRFARLLDHDHRRVAADLQLDLLHYPNQFGGAFLPKRIKRVVTLHDLTPVLFPQHHPWQRVLGYRLLIRRSLRTADHIIVDASHTAADLIARGLAPRSKVTVIPLGVSEQFKPGVRSADFASRYDLPDRFILAVGVLEPRKNHGLLIRALGRLHDRGEQIGLVIVGRDGWHWTDPLVDPAVAHLRPWVRIFRNVPDADLVEFYNRAEVFAYPSLYEGFGLPLVEAMACGTPVVASRVSSLPEVGGSAALFADPQDADDFGSKLFEVLRSSSLRRRLTAAGRRQAEEFSWRRTAEATLGVYRSVCDRAR